MKQGDLVGCSMRGGRCEGATCERSSAGRGPPPPLTIGEVFERRVVGVGSRPYSESCGSMTIPGVHSVGVLEIRRLDGLLFFLDSDGLIRISGGKGVLGGVEKVSTSGDANVKVEAMTIGRLG